MDTIIAFLKRPIVRRLLILTLIGFVLYLMRSMITLFLLTFIFIYLINAAQKFIYKHIHKYIPVNRSFIIVFIYCLVTALLVLLLWIYIPQIVTQTVGLSTLITNSVTVMMGEKPTGNAILDGIKSQLSNIDIKSYAENGGKFLVSLIGNIGSISMDLFLSIILSLFFMLQKSRIFAFIRGFRTSKLSWLYEEVKYFGVKFTNTFGKVLQTQILISFINCILSVIMLWILQFPSVLGLGVMIFLLGIVPVAGVFISLVPLSIIAFSTSGLKGVVYVLVMIAILHAVESYILNPKLMSEKTNLPVFFTFLILTVSSHFFGVWGLLVGIPVFVFLLDALDVKIVDLKKAIPTPSQIKSKLTSKTDSSEKRP
jgi:predicted PurR-regulated permease PerM